MKQVIVTMGGYMMSTGLGHLDFSGNITYLDCDISPTSPVGVGNASFTSFAPYSSSPHDYLKAIAVAVIAECLAAFAPGGYNPVPGSDGVVVSGEIIIVNPRRLNASRGTYTFVSPSVTLSRSF